MLSSLFAFTLLPLASLSLLQTSPPAMPTMPREIAAARVADALQNQTELAESLDTLGQVIERCQDPQLVAIAHYNKGVILYRAMSDDPSLGEGSIASLLAADQTTLDPDLQAKARFTLGHVYYAQAQSNPPEHSSTNAQDMNAMLEGMKHRVQVLQSSAGAFRSVIEIDPQHKQASANVERVRKQIKALQDQIDAIEEMIKQQQEQQQKKQQQQQEAADKLDELAQQQQQQADQSKEQPPKSEQEQQEQQSDQQELSEQTQQTQQELADQQSSSEAVDQKIQEAREAQERAQQAMEDGDQEQAAKEQAKAAKSLKEAAEEMQSLADESKQKSEQSQKQSEQGEEQSQAEQEAQEEAENPSESESDPTDEIAKSLLDKERREREARKAYRAKGRPIQVEKDW